MTADEFAKGMTFLGLAYNKEFDEEQVKVWFTFFYDTQYDDFRKAVSRIVSRSKFMPSIAEIKDEIVTMTNPVMQLSANEEWEQVTRAIRNYGYYDPENAVKSLNPYTANIVRMMGGFQRLCMSEDGDWTRKNFIRLFDELTESRREALHYSENQLTLSEIQRIAELKKAEREKQLMIEEGKNEIQM